MNCGQETHSCGAPLSVHEMTPQQILSVRLSISSDCIHLSGMHGFFTGRFVQFVATSPGVALAVCDWAWTSSRWRTSLQPPSTSTPVPRRIHPIQTQRRPISKTTTARSSAIATAPHSTTRTKPTKSSTTERLLHRHMKAQILRCPADSCR
jgi:hypothetical protein